MNQRLLEKLKKCKHTKSVMMQYSEWDETSSPSPLLLEIGQELSAEKLCQAAQ